MAAFGQTCAARSRLGRSDSSGSSMTTRTMSSLSSNSNTSGQASTQRPCASHRNSSRMTFTRYLSIVRPGSLQQSLGHEQDVLALVGVGHVGVLLGEVRLG